MPCDSENGVTNKSALCVLQHSIYTTCVHCVCIHPAEWIVPRKLSEIPKLRHASLVITCPTANHVAASLRHVGTKWNSDMCLRQCRIAANDRWTGHFSWMTSDLKLWRHRLQHFTACDCVQCKLALTAYCVGPRYSHHNMAAYCTYSSSRSDIPFAFHILNCALDMFSVDLHITWTYSATSGKKKLDEK